MVAENAMEIGKYGDRRHITAISDDPVASAFCPGRVSQPVGQVAAPCRSPVPRQQVGVRSSPIDEAPRNGTRLNRPAAAGARNHLRVPPATIRNMYPVAVFAAVPAPLLHQQPSLLEQTELTLRPRLENPECLCWFSPTPRKPTSSYSGRCRRVLSPWPCRCRRWPLRHRRDCPARCGCRPNSRPARC